MTEQIPCAQPAPKHTPGPWSIWTSNSFRRISSDATGRDGDVLHAVVQRSDGHPDLHFPNGGFNGPDARLIAAAPELLEALKEMEAMYTHAWDRTDGGLLMMPGSVERFDAACEKARTAIVKATGERA